jgi:hypothetical protein
MGSMFSVLLICFFTFNYCDRSDRTKARMTGKPEKPESQKVTSGSGHWVFTQKGYVQLKINPRSSRS